MSALPPSIGISVAIPCHNAARTLWEVYAGLRCQTLQPYEILFWNDASTDGTESVIGSLAARDCRIRVGKTAQAAPLGIAAVRNNLVSMAKGEIIAFLDSDVCPTEGWLAAFAETFEKHKDQKLLALAGSLVERRRRSLSERWRKHHQAQEITATTGQPILFFGGNFLAIRHQIVALGGFNEALQSNYEDFEIGQRAFRCGNLVLACPGARAYHNRRSSLTHLPNGAYHWFFPRGLTQPYKTTFDREFTLVLSWIRSDFARKNYDLSLVSAWIAGVWEYRRLQRHFSIIAKPPSQ